MKKAAGIFLATLALFVWGAVFWTNSLPYSFMERTSDDAAAGKALLEQFPRTGAYLLPDPRNESKAMAALQKAGPIATVFVQKEGMDAESPKVFALGFLHELVTVSLIAVLLAWALPLLCSYAARVGFVGLVGFVATFYKDLSMPIWWHHPWSFYLCSAVYDVVGWLVVGLVLAAFFKPAPQASPNPNPAPPSAR